MKIYSSYNIKDCILKAVVFLALFLSLVPACNKSETGKEIVEATGTVESTEVEVRSKVSGTIEELMFKEGDMVKAEDVLCVLDTEENEINLRKWEARQSELVSKYNLLKSGYRKFDVKSQGAIVKEQEDRLKEAESNFARIKDLFEKGFASRREYDRAETEMNVIRKQLEDAKSQLSLLNEGYRSEDIESGLAVVKQADAEIDLIKKKLDDARITAPVNGTITEKVAEKGEFIREGMPVALITDLNDIWLTIYISESDIGAVKQGQEVKVMIDTYPEKEFPGIISFISSETEFTPKNIQTKSDRVKLVYEVRVTLDNSERIFKPGMIADAYIDVNK